MLVKVFSVYDSKAQAFLQPFFSSNGATACRMFERAVNEVDSNFGRHAGDYELFEIGDFDDASGTLEPAAHRASLGLASSFLKPVAAPPTREQLRSV